MLCDGHNEAVRPLLMVVSSGPCHFLWDYGASVFGGQAGDGAILLAGAYLARIWIYEDLNVITITNVPSLTVLWRRLVVILQAQQQQQQQTLKRKELARP